MPSRSDFSHILFADDGTFGMELHDVTFTNVLLDETARTDPALVDNSANYGGQRDKRVCLFKNATFHQRHATQLRKARDRVLLGQQCP